jgi:transposase
MLCQQMPFAAVARIVGASWHRMAAIVSAYVEDTLAQADFSAVRRPAIDETARARGQDYLTLGVDADRRAVIFVTEGRSAATIAARAEDLRQHHADPTPIESVSIDMSAAFISGVQTHLPAARITFDKESSKNNLNILRHLVWLRGRRR